MELSDIQKRILAIKNKIRDEHTGINLSANFFEKDSLLAKLSILEREEQFLLNNKQLKISLWGGIGTVAVGVVAVIASIVIAFLVPWQQRIEREHAQIEAVYKNLVTNQDIFLSNSNGVRYLPNSKKISDLPESYIEDVISDDARKTLQNTFGLVQYRFFLYYLQQTSLLNEEIEQMREHFIITRAQTFAKLNPTASYLESMEYLSLEGKKTKFNYGKDTECLQYFLEQNFFYITIDGRGKAPICSSETLEARLFNHFGYLPADTPKWLRPHLRRALNDRETGLGDRLIEL